MANYFNKKVILLLVVAAVLIAGGFSAWQQGWISKGIFVLKQKQVSKISSSKSKTADWKTYRNQEYGFTFQYPPNYSLVAEQCTNRGYYKPEGRKRSTKTCPVGLRLKLNNVDKYINFDLELDGYFSLLEDISSISILDQTTDTEFDPQRNAWVQDMPTATQEVVTKRDYTQSGAEIVKLILVGSGGGYYAYLIPNYQKNYAVLFEIPWTRRVRCDLKEPSKQLQCYFFLDSLHKKYGVNIREEAEWLPVEYIHELHKDAERMISTFQFLE